MAITKLFGGENVEYEGGGEAEQYEVEGGAEEGEEEAEAEDEDEAEASDAEASVADASEAEDEEAESEVEAEASEAEEEAEGSEAEAESGSEAAEASEVEEGSEAEAPASDDDDEESGTKKTKAKKTKNSKNVSNISGVNMLPTAKPKTQGKPAPPSMTNEDDDDEYEEDEDDEFYLQKFDKELRDNFIADYHPEAKAHNYEEVKALARVSRDGRGIINDPLHKTIPFLSKYEMTRVVGQRAKQLDNGAKPFVRVPPNIIDGYHIALLELEQKKIPFIIKRPYPNGGVEYWHVSDLELL